MKPFCRTFDRFNDSSLDVNVNFLFKRFEVCIWNITESTGTTRLSIWSEFNLGRFSSHATDLVTEDVWVSAGDFIKFWTMTKGDTLKQRSSRSVGNRSSLISIQSGDLREWEVFRDQAKLLQDLATEDWSGDISGDQEFDIFDEDVVNKLLPVFSSYGIPENIYSDGGPQF